MAGQVVYAPPRYVTRNYQTAPDGKKVADTRIRQERIRIQGVDVPSEVRQVVFENKDERRVTEVKYSESQSPFVMSRKSVTENLRNGRRSTTETTVTKVGDEQPFGDKKLEVAQLQSVQTGGEVRVASVEVYSPDVPGGVVERNTERKEHNVLVARSQVKLVDFRVAPPQASVAAARKAGPNSRPSEPQPRGIVGRLRSLRAERRTARRRN